MNNRLARLSCLRTVQTTVNNRPVFRIVKLPDRPPRFHIARHVFAKSNRFRQKSSFMFFFWLSKSRGQKDWMDVSTSDMPTRPAGQALCNWKVWMTPLFKCSSYVEDKKVREKKLKKITRNFFLFYFFRNACVTSRAISKFHPVLTISIFNFCFPPNNSTSWRHSRRTAQPYWPPDHPEHDTEKIDDVAIKTTEISRRQEKTKKNKEQSVR